MSDDLVINIQGLSKAYPLYARPVDMLKELVFGGERHDLFWALRDVSFKVRTGQRVGIIGPNGAGKSTLLQIIAGNLQPTSGSVRVGGSISALLSLVPAWNVEQTGIENIRFNLLLRGCSTSQIAMLKEDIVDFAELGPFIHQPVKTYSSGMSARLSFAIATAISPEILIVDEVLGAGDGYFAGKATRRMKEMCDRGKALLFVSHSTAAVRQMCDTAVWLESGCIRLMGPVDYVTMKYDEDMLRSDDECVRSANIQRIEKSINLTSPDEIGTSDLVRLRLRPSESTGGSGVHYIREINVCWEAGSQKETIRVPLDATDNKVGAHLDVMGCEWGRIYSRHGVVSRMLARRTGARKGGHLMITRPVDFASQPWPVLVEWTETSDISGSKLVLEFIDYEAAIWKPFEIKSREALDDGWIRCTASGLLLPVDNRTMEQALIIAKERRISPIEIIDVVIRTKNGQTNSVLEKEPFLIQVEAECLENAPSFSICLQINRSDGVYMFWQPSDFYGAENTSGAKHVSVNYYFDENYFSSGDYEISTTAITAPWHKDVMQSDIEIYDRKLSVARFSVVREFKNLMFGAINYRARVVLDKREGNIFS
jgi:lipopolysaccharide transport system ATP-binding protein